MFNLRPVSKGLLSLLLTNTAITFTATHKWDGRSHQWLSHYRSLRDHSDVIRLFGQTTNFDSWHTFHRMKSNYLGADCLTRPHLCNAGFTFVFNLTRKKMYLTWHFICEFLKNIFLSFLNVDIPLAISSPDPKREGDRRKTGLSLKMDI